MKTQYVTNHFELFLIVKLYNILLVTVFEWIVIIIPPERAANEN